MSIESFVILVLYGSIWGSFLMVAGLRIPLHQSIVFSRSYCPHCKEPLSPIELIPLISVLIQKGKCRHCKEPVSFIYPLAELTTGLLTAFSMWHAQLNWTVFFTLFLLLSFGVVFSVTDLAYRILPNQIMHCFLVAVILFHGFFHRTHLISYLITGIGFFAFFYTFYLLFPNSIGGGDVKCYGVIGFLLGYQTALTALFMATGLACLVYFFLRMLKLIRKETPIPFAPFIFMGAYASYLTHPQLLHYVHEVLLTL